MRKSKLIFVSLLCLSSCLVVTGSVFAASYAIKDDADDFSIRIKLSTDTSDITFHTPLFSDSTCLTYTTSIGEVSTGALLNSSDDIPDTSSVLSFTFQGWYKEATFVNKVELTDMITEDLDLYAKYTRNNVLFDNVSNFYVSSNDDQTVSSRYLYKVSTQTWGSNPSVGESDKIDLTSASGVYKMTFNSSTWTILRKVGLHGKDLPSWWGNDGDVTYAYGLTEDHNSYTDKYYAGTLSTNSVYLNNSSSKKGFVYIDYTCTYIGGVRCGASQTVYLDSNEAQYKPHNFTGHLSLTSGYQYSSTNLYIYLKDNDIGGWGSGND